MDGSPGAVTSSGRSYGFGLLGYALIPSSIQYFLQCGMTAGAHPDRGLMVSNLRSFLVAGRTLPADFGSRSPVLLDLTPQPAPPPRLQTAPSSASPTRPGNHPGDPAPRPPPPASPRTSCASGSTPSSSGTSTAARSGSGSANMPAAAPTGTPGGSPATPSHRACCNTSHCPGRGGTSRCRGAWPATPGAA